jgi:predicted hydrolase (HD superfamily)
MSEFKPQVVKTIHANGEERFWLLVGSVKVVDFEQSAKLHRNSPVRKVEFLRIEDVPGSIIELHPVKEV